MATEPASEPGARARTAELLWGGRPAPRRGPRPGLTLDRIVGAAIGIADAEGVGALSMQRVAADLGVTKMALYRYVAGRDELVALMADTACGPPPEPDGEGWRSRLHGWARELWPRLRRHPWLLSTTVGPRVLGPNELGWLEAALTALADTPLGAAERMDAVALISGHVRGIAQQAPAPGAEGVEAELAAAMGPVLAAHRADYPHAAAAFAGTAAEGGGDAALDFGLERILDGLEALITRREREASGAGRPRARG
ncbi:TetR/AcrR family transcriptional regulator [Nocardiopsis composta]|uniref:AcrR family transcriptional regulator n=1 Tax=Nocardiopsis composta TaxID=157465 RepID=A0A7W8QHD5_9ACTN|nr:TetR/AcrR family transcriptional regulator C-terminal domain-containing protein [Nocardiopsis composta]MBB5430498.1 AcrR family transcriptional regulator [Nocardiopsis composta]